jgi:hypothetical protein
MLQMMLLGLVIILVLSNPGCVLSPLYGPKCARASFGSAFWRCG